MLLELRARYKRPVASVTNSLEQILAAFDDEEYVARIKVQIREGRCDPRVEQFYMQHKFGKPPDVVKHIGEDGGPVTVVHRVIVDPKDAG